MRKVKVPLEKVVESYNRTGSVWKTAKEVGLCGQVVYKRLRKAGVVKPMNKLSDHDKALIEEFYRTTDFLCGDGKLKAFAESIGRTEQFVCRYAKTKKLTRRRQMCEATVERVAKKHSEWIKVHGHPRGMLGKKHTKELKMRMRKISRSRWLSLTQTQRSIIILKSQKARAARGTLYRPRPEATWKAGWREIGGVKKYYRSKWEANYARVLEFQRKQGLITSWLHEPETFWFEKIRRGTRSYLPDFKVTYPDGHIEYHEVKGWYDDRSKTKVKRMAKYYPEVKLRMIFAKDYKALKRQLSGLIRDWE